MDRHVFPAGNKLLQFLRSHMQLVLGFIYSEEYFFFRKISVVIYFQELFFGSQEKLLKNAKSRARAHKKFRAIRVSCFRMLYNPVFWFKGYTTRIWGRIVWFVFVWKASKEVEPSPVIATLYLIKLLPSRAWENFVLWELKG